MRVLIGADPEVFLQKNGSIISAYGVIEGSKANPQPVAYGAVQVDGMALEFNIDPAENASDFVYIINHVYSQLQEMIPEGTELAIVPTAHFTEEYMEEQPYEAKELGCDPDYNAYSGERNPRPDGKVNFRTAAGHIHIGWTEDMDPFDEGHFEACRMLTRQLDIILGLLSPVWDDDTERRQLYGKLGAFRPKPYGVEYRVLSNAWLKNDELKELVFELCQYAFSTLIEGDRLYERPSSRPALLINKFYHGEFDQRYFKTLYDMLSDFLGGIDYAVFNKVVRMIDNKSYGNPYDVKPTAKPSKTPVPAGWDTPITSSQLWILPPEMVEQNATVVLRTIDGA